ncbi:MAG TPA: ATPase, T2SS/T4P/T4SS family, partial [Fimbriimonadaceae bacterium]|nr:ATPase, T2SS/T4P/T4SS family [Fimbriimonadaceae bacterium]
MAEAFSWNKILDGEEVAPTAQASPSPAPAPQQAEPAPDRGYDDLDDRDFTYRPADLPSGVHSIDASSKKFSIGTEEETAHLQLIEGAQPLDDVHLDDILRMALERKASDIHLTAGLPPMIRMDGEITPLPFLPLTPQETRRLIFDTLSDDNLQKLEETHELDFGYGVKGLARFRFNVYMQRGSFAGALRVIPTKIPSFEELGLPAIIREIAKRSSGLILVTGPTGSGKSTTIATMIDDINQNRSSHIMTIEDPIEYLHQHKKCMVNQRELHSDTYSFHAALR